MMSDTRINKFLSQKGICSRREADRLISDGKVYINNKQATLGDKVCESDEVFYDGKKISNKKVKKIYIKFNKPVGVICTTADEAKDNIVNYIDYPERIYPIGRLDVKSHGLILLTNDGSIVNKILRPKKKINKEYVVELDKRVSDRDLEALAAGVDIGGYVTKKAVCKRVGSRKFKIIIFEGKNRQIRRMCDRLGYQVVDLMRTRIGNIELDGLPVGIHEKIPAEEIQNLIS